MQSKIIIEQINSLKFTFDENRNIYDIINFIRTIENYLSFVFQTDIGIDEAVFFTEERIDDKIIPMFHHIYYNDENKSNNEVDLNNYIIKHDNVTANIGNYIFKWIKLTGEISYLNYFIRLYYSNRFVDQRIIAQINMIEALHKYYYGTKKTKQENDKLIENICNELTTDAYRKLITGLLSNKNGFGLNRKIAEIAEKAKYTFDSEDMIQEINSIRQKYSHGKTNKDIDNDKYRKIHNALKEVINNILVEEIANSEL